MKSAESALRVQAQFRGWLFLCDIQQSANLCQVAANVTDDYCSKRPWRCFEEPYLENEVVEIGILFAATSQNESDNDSSDYYDALYPYAEPQCWLKPFSQCDCSP